LLGRKEHPLKLQRFSRFLEPDPLARTLPDRVLLHAWKLPLDRGNISHPTSRLVEKE